MQTPQLFEMPWKHWLVDDFLSIECLIELKGVNHSATQINSGRRYGSDRLFIESQHEHEYPELYKLYKSLEQGPYREFFELATQQSFEGMHPRLEVFSDIGDFSLRPHYDRLEKKLTAIVFTDYEKLYPGTGLTDGYTVESKDNRCFFFIPALDTIHQYPLTHFDKVRRCLQINYWTYSKEQAHLYDDQNYYKDQL